MLSMAFCVLLQLLSIPGLDDVTTTPVAVTITAQEGAVPNVLPLSQQVTSLEYLLILLFMSIS